MGQHRAERRWFANRWVRLIAAWAASRALLVAVVLVAGSRYLPDVYLYAAWSRILLSGSYPEGDPYWQYPPGAGPLFALTALIPPNPVIGFVLLAVLADAAILALLAWAARHEGSWWGPWAWVVGGLAVGPIMLARFDLFPSLFAVAAIVLVTRPWASGIASALGGLLKVWPILLIGCIPRRRLPIAIAAAAATLVVTTVAVSRWAPGSVSFVSEQRDRGLQIEGSAAIPYLLLGMFGVDPHVKLRYGAFEVTATGAATAGLLLTAVGLLVMAGIGVLRLLGRLESVAPGDVGLALVLVSVTTSRVFSPQYGVWLVAVAVAAGASRRSRLRTVAVLIMVMSALTQVLFPWTYGALLDSVGHGVLLQTARLVLLWLATIASVAVVVAPQRCTRLPIVSRLVRSP